MQVNIAFAEQYAADQALPVSGQDDNRGRSIHASRQHVFRHRAPAGLSGSVQAATYIASPITTPASTPAATPRFKAPYAALLASRLQRTARCCRTRPTPKDPAARNSPFAHFGRAWTSQAKPYTTPWRKGRAADFDQTELYQRVFALAEQAEGRRLPRALIPRIQLHGPKIVRKTDDGMVCPPGRSALQALPRTVSRAPVTRRLARRTARTKRSLVISMMPACRSTRRLCAAPGTARRSVVALLCSPGLWWVCRKRRQDSWRPRVRLFLR